FFFFSSRRRHTRFKCDWSSDVCSSDLNAAARVGARTAMAVGGGKGSFRLVFGLTCRRPDRPNVDDLERVIELCFPGYVATFATEIGRASCRESVELSCVGV